MILSAIPKQFTVNDYGQIFYQSNSTNPLPGVMIARLSKGAALLEPHVDLIEDFDFGVEDKNQVYEFLSTWLKAHIFTTLQPLFNLINFDQYQEKVCVVDEVPTEQVQSTQDTQNSDSCKNGCVQNIETSTNAEQHTDSNKSDNSIAIAECVKSILQKVYNGMGISPRSENEVAIAQLDANTRKVLRDKKLRMGPVLIFLPELNKPASIRLRGLLWSLYHDQALPAPLPKDGAMSTIVPTRLSDSSEGANREFYRAIGYPIYGPRAIRIDMLDRVINSIYDGAKDGKFQAKHAMAEWMGCPIADLYAILTSLGHKRIENSAPQDIPDENSELETVTIKQQEADDIRLTDIESEPKQMSLFDDSPLMSTTISEGTQEEKSSENKESEGIKSNRAKSPLDKLKKSVSKKPQLDFFILRRGKAYAGRADYSSHRHRNHRDSSKNTTEKSYLSTVLNPQEVVKSASTTENSQFPPERYQPKYKDKNKNFHKKSTSLENQDKNIGSLDYKSKKAHEQNKADKKDHVSKNQHSHASNKTGAKKPSEPRVYVAEASHHDNPFAILKGLKIKS